MRDFWAVLIAFAALALTGCEQDKSASADDMLAYASQPTPPNATMKCAFRKRQICANGECREAKPVVKTTITPSDETYERCDKDGCDTLNAVHSESGAFHIYMLPDNAGMIKIGPGGDALEVLTMWNEAYLSFGKCNPVQ